MPARYTSSQQIKESKRGKTPEQIAETTRVSGEAGRKALAKFKAGSTEGLNRPSGNTGGGGGGVVAPAAPVSTLASLPQTPELLALIESGVIREGMPPEQALAILAISKLQGGTGVNIQALMDQVSANYARTSGDINTSATDWLQQIMGANMPTDPAMAALYAQDPMFANSAASLANLNETAGLNEATDLAWFTKQNQAMTDYYNSLMLAAQTGTLLPPAAVEDGGGGGGGGGGGYGGGGGGGGGSGDLRLTNTENISETGTALAQANNPGWYPDLVNATPGTLDDEYIKALWNKSGGLPHTFLRDAQEELEAVIAQGAANDVNKLGNEAWTTARPQLTQTDINEYLTQTGQVLDYNPDTGLQELVRNPELEDDEYDQALILGNAAIQNNPEAELERTQMQALLGAALDPMAIPQEVLKSANLRRIVNSQAFARMLGGTEENIQEHLEWDPDEHRPSGSSTQDDFNNNDTVGTNVTDEQLGDIPRDIWDAYAENNPLAVPPIAPVPTANSARYDPLSSINTGSTVTPFNLDPYGAYPEIPDNAVYNYEAPEQTQAEMIAAAKEAGTPYLGQTTQQYGESDEATFSTGGETLGQSWTDPAAILQRVRNPWGNIAPQSQPNTSGIPPAGTPEYEAYLDSQGQNMPGIHHRNDVPNWGAPPWVEPRLPTTINDVANMGTGGTSATLDSWLNSPLGREIMRLEQGGFPVDQGQPESTPALRNQNVDDGGYRGNHPDLTPQQQASVDRLVNAWTEGKAEEEWQLSPLARGSRWGAGIAGGIAGGPRSNLLKKIHADAVAHMWNLTEEEHERNALNQNWGVDPVWNNQEIREDLWPMLREQSEAQKIAARGGFAGTNEEFEEMLPPERYWDKVLGTEDVTDLNNNVDWLTNAINATVAHSANAGELVDVRDTVQNRGTQSSSTRGTNKVPVGTGQLIESAPMEDIPGYVETNLPDTEYTSYGETGLFRPDNSAVMDNILAASAELMNRREEIPESGSPIKQMANNKLQRAGKTTARPLTTGSNNIGRIISGIRVPTTTPFKTSSLTNKTLANVKKPVVKKPTKKPNTRR